MRPLFTLLALTALSLSEQTCSSSDPNPARQLESISAVRVNLVDFTSEAEYHFASGDPGASLEIDDIAVVDVTRCDGSLINYAISSAPTDDNRDVQWLTILDDGSAGCFRVVSEFSLSRTFTGVVKGATTSSYGLYLWPYACSNLIPCRAATVEGVPVSFAEVVAPEGLDVIVPPYTGVAAPAYTMVANAGNYVTYSAGTTPAGLEIEISYLLDAEVPEDVIISAGDKALRAATWAESQFGPYPYGDKLTYVTVDWGPAQGGLEAHPQIQIAYNSIGSGFVIVHELLHAWFGDRITYECREDFGTLSEGLVDYVVLEYYRQTTDYYSDYLLSYVGEMLDAAGTSTVTMM